MENCQEEGLQRAIDNGPTKNCVHKKARRERRPAEDSARTSAGGEARWACSPLLHGRSPQILLAQNDSAFSCGPAGLPSEAASAGRAAVESVLRQPQAGAVGVG